VNVLLTDSLANSATFVPSDEDTTVLRLALGHAILAPSGHNAQPWRFRLGGGTVELDANRTRSLLATDGDGPRNWPRARRAVARVLPRAQVEGIVASFLNQPIAVATPRPRLANLLAEPGYPQRGLRLGDASGARPTPRREVADVLMRAEEERG